MSDNPLAPKNMAYNLSPVGPANYRSPFTMHDFQPVYDVSGGDENNDVRVFSDNQTRLEALWRNRNLAHSLYHGALEGNLPPEEVAARKTRLDAANGAWLLGMINPDVNPLAARDNRYDAISLGPARADADVMLQAIQARQSKPR